MTIERKNSTIGLDKSDFKMSYGRKLYRVVALARDEYSGDQRLRHVSSRT